MGNRLKFNKVNRKFQRKNHYLSQEEDPWGNLLKTDYILLSKITFIITYAIFFDRLNQNLLNLFNRIKFSYFLYPNSIKISIIPENI